MHLVGCCLASPCSCQKPLPLCKRRCGRCVPEPGKLPDGGQVEPPRCVQLLAVEYESMVLLLEAPVAPRDDPQACSRQECSSHEKARWLRREERSEPAKAQPLEKPTCAHSCLHVTHGVEYQAPLYVGRRGIHPATEVVTVNEVSKEKEDGRQGQHSRDDERCQHGEGKNAEGPRVPIAPSKRPRCVELPLLLFGHGAEALANTRGYGL
mmetsp:Transcript_92284/g.214408  ORF Transcript_92284/g.214408 Transcript_92284/m.214408 type:complete len:209 (+) Transcript_92284:128-754(+)